MHLTYVIKSFLYSQNVTSNPCDSPLYRFSFFPNILQVVFESCPHSTYACGSLSVHIIYADAFILQECEGPGALVFEENMKQEKYYVRMNGCKCKSWSYL